MSFSVCARIKEKCVSEELLEKAIADFFQPPCFDYKSLVMSQR